MQFLRIILILALMGGGAFYLYKRTTKRESPASVAAFNGNNLSVKVAYTQPFKKGRVIFGGLVPYNKVWRTGANEATIIDVNKDVQLAGKELKAGKYSLWTIPTPTHWTIIINAETGQWGTNYDDTRDVFRVEVPAIKTVGKAIEQFKIDFNATANGATMVLNWENTEVHIPIN